MTIRRDTHLLRPAAGEVRLRLGAIGISALGVEIVATIDAVGDGVDGYAAGDRVATRAPGDRPGFRRIVSERDLIGIPKDVSFEEAAGRLPGALLARTIVRQLRPVGVGNRVFIWADPHGIDRFVAAWVRHLGATVVDDPSEPVDVVVGPGEFRAARDWRHGPGLSQLAASDVFRALREGAFESVPLMVRPISEAAGTHAEVTSRRRVDPIVLLPESAMAAA